MKGVRPVITSNGDPLPPNEVGRIAQHVRKGEGRKEIREGRGRIAYSDRIVNR